MKVKLLSRVRLFVTLWTLTYQVPPSIEFSRKEYWSGLPFPSPGNLPNRGIEPGSPTLWADTLPSEPPGKPELEPTMLQNLGQSTDRSFYCWPFPLFPPTSSLRNLITCPSWAEESWYILCTRNISKELHLLVMRATIYGVCPRRWVLY